MINMKKLFLTGIAVLSLATGTAHAKPESMLPPGFLGDWCITKDANGDIAHRKEIVGPCRKATLSIRRVRLRKDGKNCNLIDALRTMVHTQLIRYECKRGKSEFMQVVWDRTGNTGLEIETLFIDYMNEDYWKEQEKCLRKAVCQ
jgi:hypothetical protein